MPATRNIQFSRRPAHTSQLCVSIYGQGRSSGRLENRPPVAYDHEGWQVPLGRGTTLQDLCLARGTNSPLPLPGSAALNNSSSQRYTQSQNQKPRRPKPTPLPPSSPSPSPTESEFDASIFSSSPSENTMRSSFSSAPRSCARPRQSSVASTSSTSSSSSDDVPVATAKAVNSRKHQAHVPRPRNAFIIFRSAFIEETKSKSSKINQNELSKMAGKEWQAKSEADRLPYVLQAAEEKAEHAKKYPDYKYAPTGKGSKPSSRGGRASRPALTTARRTARSRAAAPDSDSDSWSEAGDEYREERGTVRAAPYPARTTRSSLQLKSRRFSIPSIASSPARSSSPTPSATHSASSPESSSSELHTDDDFVKTEDIPVLSLTPFVKKEEVEISAIPDFTHTSQDMDFISRDDIPAFRYRFFGVKDQAQSTVHNTFLPSLISPIEWCFDNDQGAPGSPASILSPLEFPLTGLDALDLTYDPLYLDEPMAHDPWDSSTLGFSTDYYPEPMAF